MQQDISRRQTLKGVGAVVVGASLAGCSGGDGGDGGDGGNVVDMTDDLVFDPDEITISAGETVVWENVGQVGHSVTAYEDGIPDDAEYFASGGFDSEEAARNGYQPGNPDSGDIPAGESYEHGFEVTGTYEYFCIPHESTMVGTIVVE